VLVTINYRLGALGFSHLAELGGASIGAVSNAGLRDQICALEWVRDHAAVFGGDPGNVTIFGESAGGMSVGTLLGTPSARGLFARAIPQSGAAHHVHSASNATEVARVLLDELGIRPGDLGRLREVPVDALLKAQMRVIQREQGGSRLLAFQPVVDGELLPAPPLDAVQGGLSARVPLLVGTTRDEWNLFLAMDPRARDLDEAGLEKRVDARVPGRAREIMELYRRERAARGEGVSPPELWSAIETDRTFRVPATRLADAQRRHQPRTFLYRFDWPSPALGGRLRACHALEVPFVFGTLDKPGMDGFAGSGPAARGLSERMMDAWLAFARGAEPRHAGLPEWPEHDEARRPTLLFDAKDSLALAPDERERRVWDGLL
jgi:para-nitrobenzyl esterase